MKIFFFFILLLSAICACDSYHLIEANGQSRQFYNITQTTAEGEIVSVDPNDWGGLGKPGETSIEALRNRKNSNKPAMAPVYPNPATLADIEIHIPFEVIDEHFELKAIDQNGKVEMLMSGTHSSGLISWKIETISSGDGLIKPNRFVRKGWYKLVLETSNVFIQGDILIQ